MGLAPEVYLADNMGVYEWQEEHSGGERPVYKLQDDDALYLYYCDSEDEWWVSGKENMLGREAAGMMAVEDKALTPDNITATWERDTQTAFVKAPEVSVCCSHCCAFVTQSSSFCI